MSQNHLATAWQRFVGRYPAAVIVIPLVIGLGIGLAMPVSELPGAAEPIAAASEPNPQPTEWTCPMHPEIRSDKPGRCPECGMDLIPVTEQDAKGHQASSDQQLGLDESATAR